MVEEIISLIDKFLPCGDIFSNHYTFKHELTSPRAFPNNDSISRWVKENERTLNLFASPTYDYAIEESYMFPTLKKKKKYLDLYESHVRDLPSEKCIILKPNNSGLPQFSLYFAFIYSSTHIYFFYNYTTYYPKNWSEYEFGSDVGWKYKAFDVKCMPENNSTSILDIMDKFVDYSTNSLEKFLK